MLTALALFVLAAWPLLLVALPPYQDLPNHVATAHIIEHPDLYPQYVFNGLFKSNCLMTLWFHLFGRFGLYGAARAFTALVLAVNALALPLFVLRFAGRRALPVAMLFAWPLVHSFSISMGFLNFAFAFALALMLLALLDRQREHATPARGLGIAVLAGVLWYAHPFPLAVVGALVALHVVTRAGWPARLSAARRVAGAARARGAALARGRPASTWSRPSTRTTMAAATFSYLNPWELVAHLWTDVSGALTRWGSVTLVPALLLPVFVWAWRRRATPPAFLSTPAMARARRAYIALPVMLSNWWYLNCRLVPFLWAGLLLRLPAPSAPRRGRAGGLRAGVLGGDGRGLRQARPRPGRIHGRDRRRAGARDAAAADVRAREDQRFHRQPDPRLGLLHREQGHRGAPGVCGRTIVPDHLPGVSAACAHSACAGPIRRVVRDAGRGLQSVAPDPQRRGVRSDLA